MIPITVNVPEDKIEFFNELLKNLQFEQQIPEWHNEIIDKRLLEYEQSPKDLLHLDEVRSNFKLR